MKSFGEHIKNLRISKGFTLGVAAANLDLDETILSDIEHRKRVASRAQVTSIASYYGENENKLMTV